MTPPVEAKMNFSTFKDTAFWRVFKVPIALALASNRELVIDSDTEI